MVSAFAVVSLVFLVVSQVGASSLSRPRYGLLLRQTTGSDYPTQCQSSCSSVDSNIGECTTIACMCTNSNANLLVSCLNCLISVAPTASVISEAEYTLDSYESDCELGGVTLSQTLSTAGINTATALTGTGQTDSLDFLTFTSDTAGSFTAEKTSITTTVTTPTATANGVGSHTTSSAAAARTTLSQAATATSAGSNPFAKSGAIGVRDTSFLGVVMTLTSFIVGLTMVF